MDEKKEQKAPIQIIELQQFPVYLIESLENKQWLGLARP